MAYDAQVFRDTYLPDVQLPLPIAGTGWALTSLQTDRTRAAVDLLLERGSQRLCVFAERRVEGRACLVATRVLMLSYYRDDGCNDTEAAEVVRELAKLLEARETSAPAEALSGALRIEQAETRSRPTRNIEIRINRDCNEQCVFCNTPADSETILPGRAAILETIDVERAAGHVQVTFTGREPTLDSSLLDYVRRAKSLGYEIIRVQTNGTSFASGPLLSKLVAAGMTDAEVSLHTLDPHTFEQLVGHPRLLDKTLQGLRVLGRDHARVRVRLVIVLTTLNLEQVPSLLEFVVRELPCVRGVTLSPVAPVGDARRGLHLLPRLGSLARPLAAALDVAQAHGLDAVVPSRCGAPLCAMPPGYERWNEELGNVPNRTLEAGKSKPASCRSCACDAICTGVWTSQLELHGTSDLRPLCALPRRE